MMQASGLAVQPCSLCGRAGRVRCCVCKSWYCTALCQANHWPVHRRECVPLPGLEWPDGSRYGGQLEDGVRSGQLEIEHVSDDESTSMKDLTFVGRVRIENIEAAGPQISDQKVPNVKKQEVAAVIEKDVKTPDKQAELASSAPAPTLEAPVKVTAGTTGSIQLKQPAVDIRAKSNPSKVKSGPIPVQPAAATMKPVPTPKFIPSQVKSAQSSLSKPAPAPVKPNPILAPAKSVPTPAPAKLAPTPAKPAPTPAKPAPTPAKPAPTPAPLKPAELMPKQVSIQVPEESKTDSSKVSTKQPERTGAPAPGLAPSSKSGCSPPYIPAYQSFSLPSQVPPPPGKLSQIVLPVEDISSPANFCVRLASDDGALVKMLESMNESPPPTVQGWTVGRRETVAAYYEDIWYRGLAVKKSGGLFSIYLLDFGGPLVNVAPEQLRPLPASLSNAPAVMYQVCLAGLGPVVGDVWGEEVGQLLGEIVNSDLQYKLGVEFLGQEEGGRYVVKLRGLEDDEDIGNMMLEGGLAKARTDQMMEIKIAAVTEEKKVASSASKRSPTSSNKSGAASAVAVDKTKVEPVSDPNKAQPAADPSNVKAVAESVKAQAAVLSKATVAADQVVTAGPKIARGVLPVNTTTVVGVCFLETPDKFYVCPFTCIEQFMTILSSAQSAPAGLVSPVVGSSCLAMDEDCWYRAEMVKLSDDKAKATVFLLDYGKTMQAPLSALRPIPSTLTTTPGLVCLVTLRGVKSGQSKWSADEVAGALIVLDVGGETQFKLKNVEVDEDFRSIVSMEDLEGNEVADLMVETGIAEKDDSMGELKLVPGSLTPGQHQLLVLSAVSPMEINLCSQAQFLHFSDIIVPMVEQAASTADQVLSLVEGDIVLACEDEVWYRATVLDVLPGDAVKVKLVDLAIMATVSKDKLRVAKVALMKEPVVAVSCCLDTWLNEDKKLALEKWGDKMEGFMEQYSEVDVEVVNMMETKAKVKIPQLEQKLGKKEVSRAEMLKMKLKTKK